MSRSYGYACCISMVQLDGRGHSMLIGHIRSSDTLLVGSGAAVRVCSRDDADDDPPLPLRGSGYGPELQNVSGGFRSRYGYRIVLYELVPTRYAWIMLLSSYLVAPLFSVPAMAEASESFKAVFENGSNRLVLDGVRGSIRDACQHYVFTRATSTSSI